MKYELAKELKDAGFPQEGEGRFLESPEHPYPESPTRDGGNWNEAHGRYLNALSVAPTLSELIEACGELFSNLDRDPFGKWEALATHGQGHEGSTPEEAVARLWLALNPRG